MGSQGDGRAVVDTPGEPVRGCAVSSRVGTATSKEEEAFLNTVAGLLAVSDSPRQDSGSIHRRGTGRRGQGGAGGGVDGGDSQAEAELCAPQTRRIPSRGVHTSLRG